MRIRKRHLLNPDILEILEQPAGWIRAFVVIAIGLFSVGIHLVATATYEAMTTRLPYWTLLLLGLAAATVALLRLQYAAQKFLKGVLTFHRQPSRNCRALVLFLSPAGDKLGEKTLTEGYKRLNDASAAEYLAHYKNSPFRAPLLAVRDHIVDFSHNRLELVIAIPSKPAPDFEERLENALTRHGIVRGTDHFPRPLNDDPDAASLSPAD